jgi:hypothetical protein
MFANRLSKKSAVISSLCSLVSEVALAHRHHFLADCFCEHSSMPPQNFRFDEQVLDYIRDAVRSKIAADKAAGYFEQFDW